MSEPILMIPLSEYNQMKKISDEFKKAFDDKAMIVKANLQTVCPGHQRTYYYMSNETEIISALNNEIQELQNVNFELRSRISGLEKEIEKKKGWFN